MGAYLGIGYKPPTNDNYGERVLSIVLNRYASDALETLFDEALKDRYPRLHEIIMEVLCLDQINFFDLSKVDFNTAIEAIRNCIAERKEQTEWQVYQKQVWDEVVEPLIKQDERYELG